MATRRPIVAISGQLQELPVGDDVPASGITNALKSATTTVDVSAAAAPTAGQVMTATSSTAAGWATPSGGGASGPPTTPITNQLYGGF